MSQSRAQERRGLEPAAGRRGLHGGSWLAGEDKVLGVAQRTCCGAVEAHSCGARPRGSVPVSRGWGR